MAANSIDWIGERSELARATDELQPQPPPPGWRPRVTGPGRIELGYRSELALREARLQEAARAAELLAKDLRATERALEASLQVERGCQRRLDRVEARLEERTQDLLASHAQQKRLSALIGALQRENELLREQLALGPSDPRLLDNSGGRTLGESLEGASAREPVREAAVRERSLERPLERTLQRTGRRSPARPPRRSWWRRWLSTP
jgi:hypothetical protein